MSKFKKGESRPENAGRKAGVPNKVTAEFKEIISDLLSNNTHKFEAWLDRIAEDDPAKAFDLTLKMMEFVVPKLSRAEYKDVDAPTRPTSITVEYVSANVLIEENHNQS